jgi:hypothetical protein
MVSGTGTVVMVSGTGEWSFSVMVSGTGASDDFRHWTFVFGWRLDCGERALSAIASASSTVLILLHSSVVSLCDPQWR